MRGALGCLALFPAALAAPVLYEHMGASWTIEAKNNVLHITADCAENTWCGFGFNKDLPVMHNSDVFTFGYHAGTDLTDCPSKGCGTACGTACGGCGATTTAGCGTACGCGATTTAGCGTACGCGATTTAAPPRRLQGVTNPYVPRVRDLKVELPAAFVPGEAKSLEAVGGVVGVAMNSVLFVHEHPEDGGMTWLFDDCGGHGDTYGHYHYHAPPLCLLKSLGVPVPVNSSWWKKEGPNAWPSKGPEVQIGWALDGAPIMGPFMGGVRTDKQMLDECHGAVDATGEYRYYLVPEAPYMPPCLRGAKLGQVESFRTSKEGQPCSQSDGTAAKVSTEINGDKVITGNGCPEHAMFQNVLSGVPFGMTEVRKLHNHGCGAHGYGTCPCGAACGACGAACGCGATTTAGCGTCGCGATTTAGCGCGATTTAGCGTACGCGATTTAGCGTACGCGATTTAGCGAACGACGACGASMYNCTGQMFCAMGLTKQGPVLSVPVSLSQCNGAGHSITIDQKQDLTSYSLTFANGRMKAMAQRAFNTGDATDYVLATDTPYYILITVGTGHQVGYHGSSATHTLVCQSTLTTKGECKAPKDWASVAPSLPALTTSSAGFAGPALGLLGLLGAFCLQ